MNKHRIACTEVDLPERMRKGLADMRTGKRRRAPTPVVSRVRAVACALRGLIEAARAGGFPEKLGADTVAAYVAGLNARGSKPAAVAAMLGELRLYARYTGDGMAWARASMRKDMRRPADLITARHWRGLRPAAERLLAEGIDLYHLKIVDAYLLTRSREQITPEEVAAIVRSSPKRANVLAMTLARLDPGSPDLHVINAGRFELNRQKTAPRPRGSARNPILSVPVNELPDEITEVLAAMAKRRGTGGILAGPTIKACETVLRQLVRVARTRGLPAEICDETMIAYLNDLDERSIAAATRHGHLRALLRYASRAGLRPDLVAKLAIEVTYYRKQVSGETKRKVRRLAENPLTLADLAGRAHEILIRAPNRMRVNERRSDYLSAAALALLSMLPLRSVDLLSLVIGQSLIRTGSGWQIDLRTSKNGFELVARLHDVLTPYLDEAILLGTDASAFWHVYAQREGGPFFVGLDGRQLGYGWLHWAMTSATGHPPHTVRSLMHDHAAGLGPEGAKLALLLCQQRNPRTAEHYRIDAERDAQNRAQVMLEEIGEEICKIRPENATHTAT